MSNRKFMISENSINPDLVPKRKLYTGDEIPAVGIGTFGSDRFSADDIAGIEERVKLKGFEGVAKEVIDVENVETAVTEDGNAEDTNT